jgi:hypothetical protein
MLMIKAGKHLLDSCSGNSWLELSNNLKVEMEWEKPEAPSKGPFQQYFTFLDKVDTMVNISCVKIILLLLEYIFRTFNHQ